MTSKKSLQEEIAYVLDPNAFDERMIPQHQNRSKEFWPKRFAARRKAAFKKAADVMDWLETMEYLDLRR
ncbi:MAG: hypothetical protein KGL39_40005 [Patescibacteria group bacterium]|nr:hypothetical protein [Patescibacteria group bacterium]